MKNGKYSVKLDGHWSTVRWVRGGMVYVDEKMNIPARHVYDKVYSDWELIEPADEEVDDTPAAANNAFWLVWCPNGPHPPKYRHAGRSSASQEATRLAMLHPGYEFIVLEAQERVVQHGVERSFYKNADVPF